MKIECSRDRLEEAVTKAERITGKHLTLPVLQCVLFRAENGLLEVSATNLEVGIIARIPAKIEKEGRMAVPARILKSFLSSAPVKKKVFISHESGAALISSEGVKTKIKTLPDDDFPSIPISEEGVNFRLPAEVLLSGISSVVYAASHSTMKPEIASVYILQNEGKLTFVATDSFRLAEKRFQIPLPQEFEPLLIPRSNAVEITQVLENDGDVECHIHGNKIVLKQKDIIFVSRVIDGQFPDYQKIIPSTSDAEAVLLTKDLIETFRLSSIFADKFNHIEVKIDPDSKIFSITTSNSEIGEVESNIEAALSGKELTLSFNQRYIAEALPSITTDSITLSVSQGRPMTIKGVGDDTFLYLVMSMNR